MKVLLREDVDNLGYAGDIHKVADGYARNFLFPRKLAEHATPLALRQAEVWRTKAQARREQLKAENDALSERINAVVLDFTANAGETGKLYGSITTAALTEALNESVGIEIDRRKIIHDPLRQLGEYEIPVRLGADHEPVFKVFVRDEEGNLGPVEVVEEVIEEAGVADDESADYIGEYADDIAEDYLDV